jgi:hypothetical protein
MNGILTFSLFVLPENLLLFMDSQDIPVPLQRNDDKPKSQIVAIAMH